MVTATTEAAGPTKSVEIAQWLDRLDIPRTPLGHLPTPLEFMCSLASGAGAVRLFVKRDDCTGLGFGGNKTRKLEFAIGAALAAGADTIITWGAWQSNYVRQVAAAAAQSGMEFHAVVSNPIDRQTDIYFSSGNLLLDRLFGADLHFVADDEDATAREIERIAAEVQADGRTPYVIPIGASNGVGALGYAVCAEELLNQCIQCDLHPSAIVLATGSGGTHGGLLGGLRLSGSLVPVIGISVSEPAAVKWSKVRTVIDAMLDLLSEPQATVADREIIVHDHYIGSGYAVPDEVTNGTIRWAAETSGLLLDPVYTGKAMAGLLDLVRTGVLQGDVIFLHTGGAPALFAYADEFVSNQSRDEQR